MTIKRTISETQGIFFVTFTCYKWLNLFSIANSYDIVYNWFDVLLANGHKIIGFVIMPNHVHAIIAIYSSKQSLNTILANGKRFMAYSIVKRLEILNEKKILLELSKDILPNEKKKGQLHKVFETSFDVKVCRTTNFIKQKLDYIHNNPCNKKWMLVNEPIEYRHSSMRYYSEYSESINSKLTNYNLL
jgi:REP element-mobilizing transposase RayT